MHVALVLLHKDWSWRNKESQGLGLAEVFHSLVVTVMQVVQPSHVLFLLCLLVTVLSVTLCKYKVSWLQLLLPSKIAFHIQGELMSQNFLGSMFCLSWVLPASVFSGPLCFLQVRMQQAPYLSFFFPLWEFWFLQLIMWKIPSDLGSRDNRCFKNK